MPEQLSKERILEVCLQKVESKVGRLQEEIQALQIAKKEETKSSAGDKYETGMAMIQLEESKLNGQLEQANREKQLLLQIRDLSSDQVPTGLGRCYRTSMGTFYTAVGIGVLSVDGETCFVLSPGSPIGKLLLSHSAGDSFSFQGKSYNIEQID